MKSSPLRFFSHSNIRCFSKEILQEGENLGYTVCGICSHFLFQWEKNSRPKFMPVSCGKSWKLKVKAYLFFSNFEITIVYDIIISLDE